MLLWCSLWASDDKAIHFVQAEKLYYENALINTEEIQQKLGKKSDFLFSWSVWIFVIIFTWLTDVSNFWVFVYTEWLTGVFVYMDRLVGLVVKASTSRSENLGSILACADGIFSGSSHTSNLKTGTPVATLPSAWCCRVSAGTGWPGVSILWLGEMESLVCNFCLSVAAHKLVWADPSLRYTCMLLGR